MLSPTEVSALIFLSSQISGSGKSLWRIHEGLPQISHTYLIFSDQFCSLIFSLSNLSFLVCSYANKFNGGLTKCGNGSKFWPIAFSLAVLPLVVRVVQSCKRYADTLLITHLINVRASLSCHFAEPIS